MLDPPPDDKDIDALFAPLRDARGDEPPPFDELWAASKRRAAARPIRRQSGQLVWAVAAFAIGVALVVFWTADGRRAVKPATTAADIDFAAMSDSVDEYFQRQAEPFAPSPTAGLLNPALLDPALTNSRDYQILEITLPVN